MIWPGNYTNEYETRDHLALFVFFVLFMSAKIEKDELDTFLSMEVLF